jgi:hypothetical protein
MRTHQEFRANPKFAEPRNLAKLLERRDCLFFGVERQRRLVGAPSMPDGMGGVFFHQVRGVRQQKRAQFLCGGIREYRALVAILDESRDIARVVDVGVGQQYPIDAGGVYWQWRPVSLAEFLAALEQAAVHQKLFAVCFN